jgi:hypothetical protein
VRHLLVLALAGAGCAIRTSGADHYVGPLFHRTTAACGSTYVSEVLHVGPLAEVGRQTGVSVGIVERVAVTPAPGSDAPCDDRAGKPLLGVPPSPQPGRWAFSPFYLRVARRGEPRLVRRSLSGAQLAVGAETMALSLGAVFTTLVSPPDDAVCAIRFDASRPMETRFTVWTVRPDGSIPEAAIFEEVQQ